MHDSNKRIVRQARFFLQGLIFSVALNVGLALTIFCLFVKDTEDSFERKPAVEQATLIADFRSHADVIHSFEKLSFEQLIAKLDSKTLIEDGFTERDLALGCLVSCFHFNLTKALSKMPVDQRTFSVLKQEGSSVEIVLFPGLLDEDFKAILHYARTEQWPLTSKGLFLRIKQTKELPESLADAFFLSSEFCSAEALFRAADAKIDKHQILAILQEGDWQMLESFAKKQKEAQDLTVAHQQRFLLDYVSRGSKKATEFMLQAHGAFAVKKLDDAHVIAMLNLLDNKTVRSEAFAKALLLSPRSTAVWKVAADRLCIYMGEALIEPYDHMKALTRFIPAEVIQEKTKVAKAVVNKSSLPAKPLAAKSSTIEKKLRTHTIKEGESLWTIAKKYKVSVEALKNANQLKADSIRTGKVLTIP
ncbi:MAG: LysM peptidoglycan-binding domain-containing protein [Chlamydiales bacterium]|nr:LysM peptidoglycan-binding domain-containing protein [Chlamydiales bacterium]